MILGIEIIDPLGYFSLQNDFTRFRALLRQAFLAFQYVIEQSMTFTLVDYEPLASAMTEDSPLSHEKHI